MRTEEVYLKFNQKVNRNITNSNISVDFGRFVFLINAAMIEVCEYLLEKKNEDDIRFIQKLVVYNKKLSKSGKTINTVKFRLPNNFLDFISTKAFASTSECSAQPMRLWEVKKEDADEVLFDESNRPSFKYRETGYIIGGDDIHYFVEDFDIETAYMSYYRFPNKIDIHGYVKENGEPSITIHPEMDDRFMERVITKAAANYAANNSYFEKFQVDTNRTINKI